MTERTITSRAKKPDDRQLAALRTRARTVYTNLNKSFGIPEWRNPLPALDELVSTILSQNTNDVNRDRAFIALRKAFPTWDQVRDARPAAIKSAIRVAGLANQKGPRIQSVLRQISQERGRLDLGFLKRMKPHEVHAWLTKFNGVGPKTAAIVMQFSLGIPAFPVDTHVYRVTGRLGLRPATMTVEAAHTHLSQVFTPRQYGPGHLNLIRLGREICHARKPDCPACPLRHNCLHARRTDSAS